MNSFPEYLKNYLSFNGRARRRDYWISYLVEYLLLLVPFFIDMSMIHNGDEYRFPLMFFIVGIILSLASLGVTVRRLHDTGHSGQWFFIQLIPVIGSFWYLSFLLADSDKGSNKYGPSAKYPDSDIPYYS